jgi:hypothetical protein
MLLESTDPQRSYPTRAGCLWELLGQKTLGEYIALLGCSVTRSYYLEICLSRLVMCQCSMQTWQHNLPTDMLPNGAVARSLLRKGSRSLWTNPFMTSASVAGLDHRIEDLQ